MVLFDLDGTLTDSSRGIINGIQYVLSKFGMQEQSRERLLEWIGPPLADSFRTYCSLDEHEARQAETVFREYYIRQGMYENAVFPGIPQLLDKLWQRGTPMLVATSKYTPIAESILEHFGLRPYFIGVVGNNEAAPAGKVEVVETALSKWKSAVDRNVVMVGDRKHDIAAAHANGIASAAVAYGFGSAEELHNAQPTYMVDSVDELGKLLLV
ncbi:HAD hydrolase-like protein [Paenibacillus thalictri]|uniref:HAD hydrolase-like protein n=1 Tax=Paenibacillus thalictri TaxID=2527873 RepID=UPI0013EF4600|nr:HAD hydrolase-like protein [Paenibacillus thalictri]